MGVEIGIPVKHEHIDPLPSPLAWHQGTVLLDEFCITNGGI